MPDNIQLDLNLQTTSLSTQSLYYHCVSNKHASDLFNETRKQATKKKPMFTELLLKDAVDSLADWPA